MLSRIFGGYRRAAREAGGARRRWTIGVLAATIPLSVVGWSALPWLPQDISGGLSAAEAASTPLLAREPAAGGSLAAGGSMAPGGATLAAAPVALLEATTIPTPARTATPRPASAAGTSTLPVWGQNAEPVTLWASAEPDADAFTTVPPGAYFRILSANSERYHVYYGGDRARRRPGEAWVDKPGLAPTEWPRFVRVGEASALRAEATPSARGVGHVARGNYVEVIRQQGEWVWVLYLGDGRDGGPATGWMPVSALVPSDVSPDRLSRMIATAEVLRQQPEVWLRVPYVSQLDGSPWALANCGPTSVAMMLAAHGLSATTAELRRQAMAIQGTPGCDDCGSYIEALAGAAEAHGLRAMDLRGADGRLRRWSTEDIRNALRANRPVLPQVKFRHLPGREDSSYYGDHYILLTGIVGDAFLYNDPIDDGPAYGRVISAEQLRRAMGSSDFPFASFSSLLP